MNYNLHNVLLNKLENYNFMCISCIMHYTQQFIFTDSIKRYMHVNNLQNTHTHTQMLLKVYL